MLCVYTDVFMKVYWHSINSVTTMVVTHATTLHTPPGAIPDQCERPSVPVTVNLGGKCNSPNGVACETHMAHSGWGSPRHLVVFLIHLVGFWSGAAGAEGRVSIMGTGTAGALRRGVRACSDHSSYRVDRMPIDFHEYICVDT